MKTCRPAGLNPTTKILLIFAVITALGQACSDQSLDDYRAAKAAQDAAADAPAAGKWMGLVTASNPQPGVSPAMGALSLDLQVNLNPQTSSDNLGSENTAQIEGSVDYEGPNSLSGTVSITGKQGSQAYYDPSSQTLSISISLTDGDGASYPLEIKGKINNGQMTGTLVVNGKTDFGGNINLALNGTTTNSAQQLASSGRGLELSSEESSYSAQSGNVNYSLKVQDRNSTASEVFLQVFSPIHLVTITLIDSGVPIVLGSAQNAQLDDQTGVLQASGPVTINSETANVSLSCTKVGGNYASRDWDCNFQGQQITFSSTPASSTHGALAGGRHRHH
jgi:hypothetical protein